MKNPLFRNVDFIKQNAQTFLTNLGYKAVGYEGMDPGLIFGGYVWFQAVRAERPELVYTIKIRRQGDSLKWIYERVLNDNSVNYVVKEEK